MPTTLRALDAARPQALPRALLRALTRAPAWALAGALSLAALPAATAPVEAAPAKGAKAKPAKARRYHLKLAAVTARPDVAADVAAQATPRVEAQVAKTFASHPQLIAALDGAPDPVTAAAAYRKFLAKRGVAGAYLVTVEVTEASTEVVPVDDKPNTQRLVMRIGVHLLGETIPGRTMGFTGDGQATIKVEVGKKIRDRDREFAWDQAAEAAIADAMATVFTQLAQPPKKK